MHSLDALVISSCERIGCENIFGVVVMDFQQTLILRSVLIKKYLESIENTNFIDRRPRKQVEKGHYLKR